MCAKEQGLARAAFHVFKIANSWHAVEDVSHLLLAILAQSLLKVIVRDHLPIDIFDGLADDAGQELVRLVSVGFAAILNSRVCVGRLQKHGVLVLSRPVVLGKFIDKDVHFHVVFSVSDKHDRPFVPLGVTRQIDLFASSTLHAI